MLLLRHFLARRFIYKYLFLNKNYIIRLHAGLVASTAGALIKDVDFACINNANFAQTMLDYLINKRRTPALPVRHHWYQGNAAVWDNRIMLHYAATDLRV